MCRAGPDFFARFPQRENSNVCMCEKTTGSLIGDPTQHTTKIKTRNRNNIVFLRETVFIQHGFYKKNASLMAPRKIIRGRGTSSFIITKRERKPPAESIQSSRLLLPSILFSLPLSLPLSLSPSLSLSFVNCKF